MTTSKGETTRVNSNDIICGFIPLLKKAQPLKGYELTQKLSNYAFLGT